MNTQKLTFVIPAKDEEATIFALFHRIKAEVDRLGHELEIIFVDDGSDDSTWNHMESLANAFPAQVRALRMRSNVGKARALAAGFECVTGGIVFTMDADLQDDPVEIPRFLEKLSEGYDIVSGYKQTRHDPWHKVLPSRVFNRMVSKLNGVDLHDHNCGFKCYRAEVVKSVKLYGEMHRMIPCLASIEGYNSAEIVVQHHPRQFGVSKYGIKRFARGFFDMITVYFLKNFRDRPMHLFGGVAVTVATLGMLMIALASGLILNESNGSGSFLAAGVTLIASLPVLLSIGFATELSISRKNVKTDTPVSIDTRHDHYQRSALSAFSHPATTPTQTMTEGEIRSYQAKAI